MSHIPASTGYTGAGATVINDDIDRHSPGNVVASHLEHDQQKGHACCQGIHAAHGGAGGPADHESVPSAGAGGQHTSAPTRGERGPIDLDDQAPKSHAAQGTGSAAPQGSVLGAGANTPVNVTPIGGQAPPTNPSAQDKAQVKTATAVAGVQEDLKGLRDRLATNEAGAAGEAKPGFGERVKGFAVKTIDHTQAALEGAKQKVTKQTTQPAGTTPES
ncbi:hypothetical protein COCSUDRAFT_48551 [Coccomyxa subellipsoidea C-169]|uniref:Uncharacterized protein n=1 Tax=Coccomyxa subellipsoidea (strain C-169) TaxID=574566 RepID=I0YQ76_COCSC|nr:hypothetical protein COCSUDRAFT_48551 [Coccomyxa subellipsoidea C-169]EIE20545.1 hypothetical protein COCSUDRAFT_48551 [Coccomyxa subellipsoidea C-169]|eukprot:XP_005645089.1 hypothetical protein COCSUDRAFT_48551 [Coccomyxa subellipsoidea C-169]